MSMKEISRLEELRKFQEGRQAAAQAADNLNLSERQILRPSKELKEKGPNGLISKKVGARCNHRLPDELKDKAIGLIFQRYRDFGPTLAHEYLTEQNGLKFSVTSTRNIMLENGIWHPKRARKKRVFQLRPRRAREGELIQLDGSDHAWFEEEALNALCYLISMIPQAKSCILNL